MLGVSCLLTFMDWINGFFCILAFWAMGDHSKRLKSKRPIRAQEIDMYSCGSLLFSSSLTARPTRFSLLKTTAPVR